MTTHTTPPTIRPADLPATIRAFLAARVAGEADVAFRTFSPNAVVVDQDETFRGVDQVLDFLHHAGSEFNRIEGNFPGGVADLTYRFTLTDDLISEMTIR